MLCKVNTTIVMYNVLYFLEDWYVRYIINHIVYWIYNNLLKAYDPCP